MRRLVTLALLALALAGPARAQAPGGWGQASARLTTYVSASRVTPCQCGFGNLTPLPRGRDMSRKKVSTTIYITPEQADRLKLLHDRTKVPIAVFIREGIDMVLKHYEHVLPGQMSLDPGAGPGAGGAAGGSVPPPPPPKR